jgi:hypothetical protein
MHMHRFRRCFAVRAGERLAELEDPGILKDNWPHRTSGIPCAHFLSPPARGPQASFGALARRYAGDIAPVTIMKELARVGALVDGAEGRLRAVKRYYLTPDLDPARTLQAGSMLEDFGEAVRHSLLRTEAEPPRFVGRASNRAVRATAAGAFGEFVQGEAQAFLERVDAWLSAHEVDADAARRQRGVRLGLGVFEIRDEP